SRSANPVSPPAPPVLNFAPVGAWWSMRPRLVRSPRIRALVRIRARMGVVAFASLETLLRMEVASSILRSVIETLKQPGTDAFDCLVKRWAGSFITDGLTPEPTGVGGGTINSGGHQGPGRTSSAA